MNRIVSIARMQTLGRLDALVWPLGVLLIAFTINILIFASLPHGMLETDPISGALASIYITCLAFGAVAVNQHFPLALGLSVTRREFTLGLGLFAAVQVVAYAIFLVVMQAIEDATDGWGLHLRFFGLGVIDEHAVPVQFAIYAVPMLAMTLLGTTAGALYMRWRATGLITAAMLVLLVLGGAAALIGHYDGWPAVGRWFVHSSLVTLTAGWPLLLVALLGAGSWAALRRATP
ncbi:hypothetical protein Dvina_41830 [Dactylosporangium vinaceum]|uniref:ABC transporter permease n=1 Tax=Dactylosporangium vinaceum TaxID=53362 RepID=A0ABV5M8Q6_9ACTN|nr:hypothetical protein [Dactylosporangium vinaceum]UAB94606.1 hypothetical protein Dvina_41830 [Dactylosporangium vinaceum]